MPRYAALCSIAAKLQPLGFVDGNLAMLQHILCDEIRDFCQIFRHKRPALVAAVAAGAGGAVIVEAERERCLLYTSRIRSASEVLSYFKLRGKDPRKPKGFSWSLQGGPEGNRNPSGLVFFCQRFLLEK